MMEHWKKVLPVPMLEVEYEQTVEDLEGVARKMIEFCGLEWDPACLAFHESKRTVRTASLSQVRQPVYKRSVQRLEELRGRAEAAVRHHRCAPQPITVPAQVPA